MTDQMYLGDGVYAEWDGYQVGLRCDCMSVPNTIFLEPQALRALNIFVAKMTKPAVAEDAHEQID